MALFLPIRAHCLRQNGVTEEELSYDHLLLMGEYGVDKVLEKVTALLDSYEKYSLNPTLE